MKPPDGKRPSEEVGFAELARSQGATFDRLLLALAAEFRPVAWTEERDRLDALARPLFGIARMSAEAAAKRIAASLWHEAGLRPSSIGTDVLFLDRTLRCRRGHPALLAAIYVEVARRAGLALSLLSSPDAWFAGVTDREGLVLVELAASPTPASCQGRLRVRRQCPHELAYAVLSSLAGHLSARGRAGEARRARQLALLLPLHRDTQEGLRRVRGGLVED
ncbi:MAG: transglutaminase family protein [Solirubrobacterales bacterium]